MTYKYALSRFLTLLIECKQADNQLNLLRQYIEKCDKNKQQTNFHIEYIFMLRQKKNTPGTWSRKPRLNDAPKMTVAKSCY